MVRLEAMVTVMIIVGLGRYGREWVWSRYAGCSLYLDSCIRHAS